MVDAFFDGGNSSFDKLALNEFLDAELKNEYLRKIQSDIQENIYIPNKEQKWPDVNESYLRSLSDQLKTG